MMRINTVILFSLFVLSVIVSCASAPDDSDDHGFNGVAADAYDNSKLSWRKANLTWYESYPDPGSEECIEYSGCEYSGELSYFEETKSPSWINNTNIAAVHSDDWDKYAGKILRIKQGSHQVDVMVYDLCSDDDCDGCCSDNMSETGFLIDMELHTLERFGGDQGVVEWSCLDCD
jgi:hypothetical protein